MPARPGKSDELIDLLLSATTDGSGASQHCVVYLVGRSATNRDVVHVTEGWTTREAHAENFATEQAKAFVARIEPLLADEPRFQDEVPLGGKFRDCEVISMKTVLITGCSSGYGLETARHFHE